MSYGKPSTVKFLVNESVFANGPAVDWAIVLLNPANEVVVAGWVTF